MTKTRGLRTNIYREAESFVRNRSKEMGISCSAVMTLLVHQVMRGEARTDTANVNLALSDTNSVNLTPTTDTTNVNLALSGTNSVRVAQPVSDNANHCQALPRLEDLGPL